MLAVICTLSVFDSPALPDSPPPRTYLTNGWELKFQFGDEIYNSSRKLKAQQVEESAGKQSDPCFTESGRTSYTFLENQSGK